MGIIRNSIDITGITPENELPHRINGQLVEYSEVDYIFVPENKPRLNSVFQISVKVEVISKRVINTPLSTIVVLDGEKHIKVIYTQKGHSEKASVLNLCLPFNTFVDLPKKVTTVEDLRIFIADAYFHVMESRKLYSHILYIIDVHYDSSTGSQGPDKYYINSADGNAEIDIKISNQAFNEMSLSSIYQIEDTKDENMLIDIDAEYL